MFVKIISILSTVTTLMMTVMCEPPNTQYGTPLAPPITNYGGPSAVNSLSSNQHNHHDDHGYGEPMAYEFGYQVKDDYSGNNYNRQETSDGNQVKGEYRVALPDGRTQIVTYYADWQTGFHADVRYEGTASYPEHYNTYQGGYNKPSNQYGAPGFGQGAGNYQANYNNNNFNNAPATSSVSIKDYSTDATPYNTGNNYNYNNNNNNNNFNGNYNNLGQGYDSYTNAASFANKARPNTAYGAP